MTGADMALPRPPDALAPDAKRAWWAEIAALQVLGPLDPDVLALFALWCHGAGTLAAARTLESANPAITPIDAGAEEQMAGRLRGIQAVVRERKAWRVARGATAAALAATAQREALAATVAQPSPAPLLPPTPAQPAPVQAGPALRLVTPESATEAPATGVPHG